MVVNKVIWSRDEDELDYLSPLGDGVAVNHIGYGNSSRKFLIMTTVLVILLSLDGRMMEIQFYGPYGLEDPDIHS